MGLSSARRNLEPSRLWGVLAIAASLSICIGVFLFRDQMRSLSRLGYPGVFLTSLLGSATVFLPVPSFLAVIALGGVLNPIAVGIVAGLGAALGELTGYLAGRGGRVVFPEGQTYQHVQRWMQRYGAFAIFVLAAIPNPFFDLSGMIAGVMRMPLWQFVLATWVGKSIRMMVLAASGAILLN